MKRNIKQTCKFPLPAFCVLILLSVGSTNLTFAQPFQRIEIPSSPNPVGSGARALGMGGAFIAIADDATAASWNPGGLIQLETPEISFVGAYFNRVEDNDLCFNPEASCKQSVSKSSINYLSAAYPFTLWGHNMIVSLNYQNLYDFSREWIFPLSQTETSLTLNQNVFYEQEGSLSAIGIAYSIQINPGLSFGVTFNFWEDSAYENEWEQKTRQTGVGIYRGNAFSFDSTSFDRYSFDGFNANLGALWNVSSRLTLGVVLKTPFSADIEHQSIFSSTLVFPSSPGSNTTSFATSVGDEELDMPMSYGIGLAYRFSDELTTSIDIYRTEWGDFILKDSSGNKTSPVSGKPEGESDIDPTFQVRMGVEYLFINPKYVIPLRGGVFYDPAPAEGSPDDFYGFSIGSGIAKGRFVFDIAYQYRFGSDVGTSILQNLGFSQDVDEHTIYSSLIFHF